MKNTVKTHPLSEILSKKLFSIENVPKDEQKKMVSRAIKSAVEFYEDTISGNKINPSELSLWKDNVEHVFVTSKEKRKSLSLNGNGLFVVKQCNEVELITSNSETAAKAYNDL